MRQTPHGKKHVILIKLTPAEYRIVEHAAAFDERAPTTFAHRAVVAASRVALKARVEAAQVALVADALLRRRAIADRPSTEEVSSGTGTSASA